MIYFLSRCSIAMDSQINDNFYDHRNSSTSSSFNSKTYEQLFSEVNDIISKIENNDVGLEELIDQVNHAHNLIKSMEQKLSSVKNIIDKLNFDCEDNQDGQKNNKNTNGDPPSLENSMD